MNREEIRGLVNKGYSVGQIVKLAEDRAQDFHFERGFKFGMKEANEIFFYMSAYVAQMEFDLEPERLIKFMKRVYDNIDSYRTGQLEPSDFDIIKGEMIDLGLTMK